MYIGICLHTNVKLINITCRSNNDDFFQVYRLQKKYYRVILIVAQKHNFFVFILIRLIFERGSGFVY